MVDEADAELFLGQRSAGLDALDKKGAGSRRGPCGRRLCRLRPDWDKSYFLEDGGNEDVAETGRPTAAEERV